MIVRQSVNILAALQLYGFCVLAGGIYRAEKHTGANPTLLTRSLRSPVTGITVFSDKRQPKCKFVFLSAGCHL